jgi:hypothetical protein
VVDEVLMVESEQVKDRRLKVVDVRAARDARIADLIRFPV